MKEAMGNETERYTEAKKFGDTYTWKPRHTKGGLERKAGRKK